MKYIHDCLESIRDQRGDFGMELVWINDGSDKMHTTLLKKSLDNFQATTRNIVVKYYENDKNMGIGYSLNKGIPLCSHELIVKMDSDDIMMPDRIRQQIEYMYKYPSTQICGGQIKMFYDTGVEGMTTSHSSLRWEEYVQSDPKSHWFINHPTVCYRKSAVLAAGNYDANLPGMCEDFELELRMLKVYGFIYNFPDVLLKYRLHDQQITHKGGAGGGVSKWGPIRDEIVRSFIEE